MDGEEVQPPLFLDLLSKSFTPRTKPSKTASSGANTEVYKAKSGNIVLAELRRPKKTQRPSTLIAKQPSLKPNKSSIIYIKPHSAEHSRKEIQRKIKESKSKEELANKIQKRIQRGFEASFAKNKHLLHQAPVHRHTSNHATLCREFQTDRELYGHLAGLFASPFHCPTLPESSAYTFSVVTSSSAIDGPSLLTTTRDNLLRFTNLRLTHSDPLLAGSDSVQFEVKCSVNAGQSTPSAAMSGKITAFFPHPGEKGSGCHGHRIKLVVESDHVHVKGIPGQRVTIVLL